MRMNSILKSKLREFAHDIHKHIDAGNDDASVKSLIREQMSTIYRYVRISSMISKASATCLFDYQHISFELLFLQNREYLFGNST